MVPTDLCTCLGMKHMTARNKHDLPLCMGIPSKVLASISFRLISLSNSLKHFKAPIREERYFLVFNRLTQVTVFRQVTGHVTLYQTTLLLSGSCNGSLTIVIRTVIRRTTQCNTITVNIELQKNF